MNIVKCSRNFKFEKWTKCSRNFKFEKWTDQNVIPQNLCHVKEYRILKGKKMSKRGYLWIYFGFCWAVVHFWVVLVSGGYILVGNGWWWVVVDMYWLVVDDGIVKFHPMQYILNVWRKITYFKWRISVILWSFSS